MIRIVTLVENTTLHPHLRSKHGLSIYLETSNHRILFDVGPNDLFVENAEKLGIDIAAIDTVVISHGHVDHGGGLAHFLQCNDKARIYVHESAFEGHYTRVLGLPHPIGIDAALKSHPQVVLVRDELVIDDELTVFAAATGRVLFPSQNRTLLARENDQYVADDFRHEQYLVVSDHPHRVLFSGCSHNGVLNILQRFEDGYNTLPTHLIGGFHQYNPTTKQYESEERIGELARQLTRTDLLFYTCHCTGAKAYTQMRDVMGSQLEYLSVGSEIFI